MKFVLSILGSKNVLIRNFIYIALGVLFCAFPENMKDYFVLILGFVFILIGLISFTSSVIASKISGRNSYSWSSLLICSIIGLVIIYNYSFFAKFLLYCFGGILVLFGIESLSLGISSRKVLKLGFSWLSIPIPFLLLASGLLIIFDPFKSAEIMFTLFGAAIILFSTTNIIRHLHTKVALKKAGKKIVDGEVEDIEVEDIEYEEV